MPAVRKDGADFEDIAGSGPARLKCLPCSLGARKATTILVTSLATHRKTPKHVDALKSRDLAAVVASTSVQSNVLPVPAAMTLATQFSGYDSDDLDDNIPGPGPESNERNPFDNTISYGSEIIDAGGNQLLFSAGEVPVDTSADRVWKDIESLDYFDHTLFADMTPRMADLFDKTDDCTVSDAVRAMEAMGLDDSDDDEEEEKSVPSDFDKDWAPHGSKTMFMLDLLDNLPRLRLSDDHLKAIIWVMKECGTPDVPSFYALRKLQQKLTREVGLKPRQHTSTLSNLFYMNHPNDLIRLDFANPLVRKHLHFYPEITSTISESWQAAKYVTELEADDLSPMWSNWKGASHRHFYVKELAQCSDGTYYVPLKWIVYEKEVHAEAYLVTQEASGIFTVEEHEVVRILATDLRYNYLDLRAQGAVVFSGVQNAFKPHTPHPVRTIAGGRPVFILRIMPWADDVSGNRSKQYNAHMNMYLANLNLPHKQLAQEYHVRFCSTSPHASSLEQFDALAEDCKQDDWTSAYDCELQQEILFRLGIHLLPADNPQQAETTSTMGSSSNLWCREDYGGGSATERETDEGYHALFAPARPRKPEETVEKIKQQIKLACLGVADAVELVQKESGVKDKIAEHWIQLLIEKARKVQQERVYNKDTRDPRLNDPKIKGDSRKEIKQAILEEIQEELYAWVIMQPEERYESLSEASRDSPDLRPGDHYNVLLRLRSLDPHRDSPCEILHTVLLGEDKYTWHETTKAWNPIQGALFAARLQSAFTDGLNIPPLRAHYMVQYKNGLIGKHFKSLQQLAIFQLDSKLCSAALFELWKANGVLGALLWYPVIKDMDQYLADLKIAINNVLDRWAVIDPSRILYKYKLHVLPHIPEGVRRFGPSILFETEVFECWNNVFRLCSVLSNHQAPSLDIATTLADMERFKHQVSGGWWKSEGSEWIRAGYKIHSFLTGNKQLQRRLGWTPQNLLKPGTVKVLSQAKRSTGSWKTVLDLYWKESLIEPVTPSTDWKTCKYIVARSEDLCFPGSWVFFKTSVGEVAAGRIIKIMAPEGSNAVATILMNTFLVSEVNHTRFDMPVLLNMNENILVKPEQILFKFNAQHDCQFFGCRLEESTGQRQERVETKITRKVVAHVDDSRFILNMHALHNAHLIRETLPRHLTEPKPCFADRKAKHFEFAAALRQIGPEKRAQIVAKGQATKARNKQAKADRVTGVQERAH